MKLPIPKMDWKTMAGVAVGFAVLIVVFQNDIRNALANLSSLFWPWGAGLIALGVAAWYLSQRMNQRLTMEIPPAAEVVEWCCEHSREFRNAGIYRDDIDWSPLSFHHEQTNNRMAACFRLIESGLVYFMRADVSPKYYLKITKFEQGWKSNDDLKKLLQPEMMLDVAELLVKEHREKYEENKED